MGAVKVRFTHHLGLSFGPSVNPLLAFRQCTIYAGGGVIVEHLQQLSPTWMCNNLS